MNPRLASLAFAALCVGPLVAQPNTVVGLDGRLTVVDNLTYYGRRGPAHPNGEIGTSMLYTMCNPGSVNIPWFAPMQPDHPMFAFLIARVHNDKIEQINDWSFVKHAFAAAISNGACGTCQNPGTSSLMGINCSDTYGASTNASRTYLGPPEEINPWLNEWPPVGSYFDIGDPSQAGYPAPADGVRSLSQSIFDSVDNRVTIDEIDLTTAGASYYYGMQMLHRGEALANRGDNLAHRGMAPSFDGSSWSFPNNSEAQAYGSVLDRWSGATVDSASNGLDDGRFYVASKATSLGGGHYHYEYAVHNVDNSRGGGSFRVPIDTSATASNFTFGDLDIDDGNDWSMAQIGNEVVFTAASSNPLEWNAIYNFGFDADFAPGSTTCAIDEHRPGAGASFVNVAVTGPSGATFAVVTSVGTGCGGSGVVCAEALYEESFDLANSSFTLDYNAGEYTLVPGVGTWIAPSGVASYLSDDALLLSDDDEQTRALPFLLHYPGGSTNSLTICSNGFVSPASNGTSWTPGVAELLSGLARWAPLWHDLDPSAVGSGPVCFSANSVRAVVSWDGVQYWGSTATATFQIQFWVNGDVHVIYQNVAGGGNGYLIGHTVGGGAADPGPTDISASLNTGILVCGSAGNGVPDIALGSSGRPIIGTTIDLITTNAPADAASGLSILSLSSIPGGVDLTFLGMPGCSVYQNLDVIDLFSVVAGSGQCPFVFPNNSSLSGVVLWNQAVVIVPGINAFNMAASNGLELLVGIH